MTNLQHGASHFVHDFAGIDLPLADVVAAIDLIATPALFGEIVATAWVAEVQMIDRLDVDRDPQPRPVVEVAFGTQRTRNDALILPVAWSSSSDAWVPPIDADLEFASFGPDRTHVHLYGSSELPPSASPTSARASMAQRLTVAVVRHVLDLLTLEILAATEPT